MPPPVYPLAPERKEPELEISVTLPGIWFAIHALPEESMASGYA
jgi:hypothetical protein